MRQSKIDQSERQKRLKEWVEYIDGKGVQSAAFYEMSYDEIKNLLSQIDELTADLELARMATLVALNKDESAKVLMSRIDQLKSENLEMRKALEEIAKSFIEGGEEKIPNSEWSMGNYDDVFSDGVRTGEHYQAEVAREALSPNKEVAEAILEAETMERKAKAFEWLFYSPNQKILSKLPKSGITQTDFLEQIEQAMKSKDEAISEAELAEKIVKWCAKQPCPYRKPVFVRYQDDGADFEDKDCLECPPCLARKLMEGK